MLRSRFASSSAWRSMAIASSAVTTCSTKRCTEPTCGVASRSRSLWRVPHAAWSGSAGGGVPGGAARVITDTSPEMYNQHSGSLLTAVASRCGPTASTVRARPTFRAAFATESPSRQRRDDQNDTRAPTPGRRLSSLVGCATIELAARTRSCGTIAICRVTATSRSAPTVTAVRYV